MFANMRPLEIVIIVAVIVLLFGAKKLPELARALGESLHILRKEVAENPSSSTAAAPPSAPVPSAAPANHNEQAASAAPTPTEHMG